MLAEKRPEVTPDMIDAGLEAFASFDPEQEDVEELIFHIIHRALVVRHVREHLAPEALLQAAPETAAKSEDAGGSAL